MRDPLELRLADLAVAIDWPPTPDLVASVAAEVRTAGTPRGWRFDWASSFGRPMRRSLLLAVAALLLVAGAAAALGIALGGLRIVLGESPPVVQSVPPGLSGIRGLGRAVTLDEARRLADFEPVLPSLGELGTPDHVFFTEPPAGGQVALAWRGRPGYPAQEGEIGLVLTQFRADIGPDTFEKMISGGTRVTHTQVRGANAWWVEGGEHFIYYVDARGAVVETTIRLVGDTLIWEQAGLTLRLEGATSLDAALRVAESVGG